MKFNNLFLFKLAWCIHCFFIPFASSAQSFVRSNKVMPEQTKNYLIIANPEVIGWLNEFVTYRSEDYNVRIVNTAIIGNTKEKIKAYIQAQYDNFETRPEYLLLAMYRGNERKNAIPWFTATTNYVWDEGPELIPSYNWYSLLSGNDLIPDVYMGIVFLESKTEAENLLFKIKSTETNGFSNPKNVGYFMSLGWENVTEWASMVSSAGYSQYAFHVPDDGGTQVATTAEFVQLLKKNLKLYYLNGHGAPPGLVGIWADWALKSNAKNSVFPLAFSGACNTGSWFLNNCVEMDVFPEALVVKSKDLAVAMLANSFYGGHYDKPMYKEIFRLHMLDGVSQVGKLAHYAKLKCLDINTTDATPFYAFNFEMVHLWGDPATELNGRSKSRTSKLVHVVFGTGSGYYASGQNVAIKANPPANSSFEFDRWVGDTSVVANCFSSTTTIRVPNRDVQAEAIYKITKVQDIPGIINAENANQREGGIPIGIETPVVSLLQGGNWYNYNVDVKTSGKYSCIIRYSTLYNDAHVKLLDADKNTELSQDKLPVVGDVKWYAWGIFKEHIMTKQFDLVAGKHTLQLKIDSGTLQYDWLKFSYVGPSTIVSIKENRPEQNSFDLRTDGSNLFYRVPSISGKSVLPIKLSFHSLQGVQIANLINEMKMPGDYSVSASDVNKITNNLPKGLYLCMLQSGNYRKSVLIKIK